MPSAPSAQRSWLDSVTLSTIHAETSEENGFVVHTQILDTTFHKRWLRLEQHYDAKTEEQPRLVSETIAVANEYLAKTTPGTSLKEIADLAESAGAAAIPIRGSAEHYRIRFSVTEDLATLADRARELSRFSDLLRYVEPDYLVRAAARFPTDPRFRDQRAFNDPRGDNDIDAPEAWAVSTDASNIKVAVIDSGLRLSHEDLSSNLWSNPNELPNGSDDDGNGLIDDLHGFNAISDSGDVADESGHGTHVAGIIGAKGDNGVGVAGIAWSIQLMPLKFLAESGFGTTSDAIECINYAVAKEAHIINNSWGGTGRSVALFDALEAASNQGILIVTSAGNEGNSLDAIPVYPAAFDLPLQIVVASVDETDGLASYSNYSPSRVDLAAPGRILSAYNTGDSEYITLEGTSMAAPMVTGSLALLMSHQPEKSPAALIISLLDSVDLLPSLAGRCAIEGRLNLHRLLVGDTNAPQNDDFSQASPFPARGGQASGTTTAATLEPSEPKTDPQINYTVWHSWTPERNGQARLELSPRGFRGSLAIWQGDQMSSLQPIASNASNASEDIRLTFPFVSGGNYRFQVGAIEGIRGPYTLSLLLAPENDSLASAVDLSGDSFAARGSNRAAGLESGELPLHPSAAGSTVWYAWTAPQSADFHLRIAQTAAPMFVRVFEGDVVTALQAVPSVLEEFSQSNQFFFAEAGKTYRIAVDSLSTEGVDFLLDGSYLSDPRIVEQPRDVRVQIGGTARFSVRVYGRGVPQYQWFKNGEALAGADRPRLTLSEVTESDYGSYHVRIQISGFEINSRQATLAQPETSFGFLSHPASASVAMGEAVRLSAIVSGDTQNAVFQWLKDGQPLQGRNDATLNLTSAQTSDTGFYQLRVSRGDRTFYSQSAFLTVSADANPRAWSWTNAIPSHYDAAQLGAYFLAFPRNNLAFSIDGFSWQYANVEAYEIAKSNQAYFTAAGNKGVFRSDDLVTWTNVLEGPSVHTYSIAASDEVVLAFATHGILRSTDNGASWTTTLEAPRNNRGKVAWGNGLFVVTLDRSLRISADGVSWQTVKSPSNRWLDAKYGGGQWWLYDEGGGTELYTSIDGENWIQLELPFDSVSRFFVDSVADKVYVLAETVEDPDASQPRYFVDVFAYHDGVFELVKNLADGYAKPNPPLAAKDGEILAFLENRILPLDEITRNHPDLLGSHRLPWEGAGLSYANGRFLASNWRELLSSKDGSNWTAENYDTDREFGAMAYGNGRYVGSNHYGGTLSQLSLHSQDFNSVAFGNGVFVGASSGVKYSTNGASWKSPQSSIPNASHVVFGNGVFVAYLWSSVYRSTDGKEWSQANLPEGVSFDSMVYHIDRFLAFSGDRCFTSTDGQTWTAAGTVSLPGLSGHSVSHLFSLKQQAIAYFADRAFFSSTDGANWQQRSFGSGHFGNNARPSFASSGDSVLVALPFGLAILGQQPQPDLSTQVLGPARNLAINAGQRVQLDFLATSSSSTITSIQILVNGQIDQALHPDDRSFVLQLDEPGDYVVEIRVLNDQSESASSEVSLSVSPLIHTAVPQGDFYPYDFAYFKGALHAASDAGRVYVSADGISWKVVQTPSTERITGLAASDQAMVATLADDGVLYSEDGIRWLQLASLRASEVTYDGNVFVAGDALSRNGRSWFSIESGQALTAAADLGGRQGFVFNAEDYRPYVYRPGKGSLLLPELRQVYHFAGAYLAIRNGRIVWSADLTTWTDVTPDDDTYGRIEINSGVAFSRDPFGRLSYVSGDGQNWVRMTTDLASPLLTYSDGYFYAIAVAPHFDIAFQLVRSSNGVEWEPFGEILSSGTYAPRFEQLQATPFGVAVVSGNNGTHYYFVGEEIVLSRSSSPNRTSIELTKLIGSESPLFITRDATLRLEEDGSWQRTELKLDLEANYAAGVYLDIRNSTFWRSTDATEWTPVPWPAWLKKYDIIGIERLYSLGDEGFAATIRHRTSSGNVSRDVDLYARSSDGIAWEPIGLPPDTTEILQLFTFKDHLYARATTSSLTTLFRSSDGGTSWEHVPPLKASLYDTVATSDRLAMPILDWSYQLPTEMAVSSNGVDWTIHPLPETGFNHLVATDEAFYLAGQRVWKSIDGKSWSVHLPENAGAASSPDHVVFYTDSLVFFEPSSTDLALANASLQSGNYAAGDRVPVELTLSNRGPEDLSWAAEATVSITFSREPGRWAAPSIDDGFTVQSPLPFHDLAQGATRTASIEVELPRHIRPGPYYATAFIAEELIAKDGNPSNDFVAFAESATISVPTRQLTVAPADNGEVSGIDNRSAFAQGEQVLLTAVPDFGYEFAGWTGDLVYGEETLLVTLEQNTHLIPAFRKRSYRVAVKIVGKGSVTGLPEDALLHFGDPLELTAQPADGWAFVGWEGYGQSSSSTLTATVGRDLTIRARFGQSFSAWVKHKYGDDPEMTAPLADPANTGMTNLERFALGFDFPEQRQAASLGMDFDGTSLRLRYAVNKSMIDYRITPRWREADSAWSAANISLSSVGETDDLLIFEATFTPPAQYRTALLGLHIEPLSQ